MKNLKSWLLGLGVVFFLVWGSFASFLYLDHSVNYPEMLSEKYGFSRVLFDSFNWEDDTRREEAALLYARSHGREHEANLLIASGFRFLRPIWTVGGYLRFVALPITSPIKTFNILKSFLGYNSNYRDDVSVNRLIDLIFLLLAGLLFGLFISICLIASVFCWSIVREAREE